MAPLGLQQAARPLQRPVAARALPRLAQPWRQPLPQRRQQQRVWAEQPQHGQQGGAEPAEHAQSAEYLSDSELEDGPVGKREKGVRRALQLPLEAAATLSKEDAHYLQKRQRSSWWRRSKFPQVPADTIADVDRNPPALQLWGKVLPLGLIFFVASFNLTILQNLKDAIMVTTAGAETLPFLASCVVLPASLAFFMLYGKIVEALPSRAVFYAALSPLVAFYLAFATLLYPLHGSLHLNGFYAATAALVPQGLHGLLKVIEYWTFSLFYCASELWGSVVISVLFWSLANEVCTVSEAKTVYPLMGIAANVALVLSGSWVKWVNATLVPAAGGSTQAMLNYLIGTIVLATGVMMAAKFALDRWCVGEYCAITEEGTKPGAGKKKKQKSSFSESFAVVRSSPKIMNLALLVVSYGVSHRLFEFAWKGQLRALYPTPAAYQGVLADVSIATGWCTILLMLCGKFVFQYMGWSAAASATPAIMLAAGAGFFGLSLAANQGISLFGMDPAAMAFAGVAAGAVTQVFARSSKFSLFDPAKEMVYIEMSREEKSKGKAAVDLLGSQIGKSGGAWLTQAVLLLLGSISASMPLIATFFTGVIAAWLGAVQSLAKQLREYEEQKAAAAATSAGSNGSAGVNGSGPNSATGVGAAAAAVSPQAA
ncbi:ADP,ATP carrier 1 isoform A [Chlorella sorokiniana]|uniref:ADP,ATP carrier protein n=1 Tax=Chlorella sorokiniana TaxID=3076 RepID=A0A2P6TWC2_CHLSO|nr:ADP,ATP carrier 1 isoform A [Chlorella sorokiniana]|eukprot:PRW58365.1 ADP,ATP carrier 1 isoform A [Chlorella sorokiniana]